ncbi:MAG: hypothetical protein VR75_05720 [Hyphomonadaceae bacterium BRH_c29]|nr:MAG: hypothetical protein VR75_05720 [Hyphomonadaceae bacterium BRH_c29]
MVARDRSKKTDKIEVRLAPETKQAFHETCEQQGESASGVIRRLIEEYVRRFHQPVIARPMEAIRRTPWWARWGLVAGLGAVAAGVAFLPSNAESSRTERFFNRIDADGDGQFDLDDYLGLLDVPSDGPVDRAHDALVGFFGELDADTDGIVTWAEFYASHVAEDTRLFHDLDTDGDEGVSFAEFTRPSGVGNVRASISGMASGTAFRQGSTPEEFDTEAGVRWSMGQTDETPPAVLARLGQVFRDLDADDDGRISLEEFLAR